MCSRSASLQNRAPTNTANLETLAVGTFVLATDFNSGVLVVLRFSLHFVQSWAIVLPQSKPAESKFPQLPTIWKTPAVGAFVLATDSTSGVFPFLEFFFDFVWTSAIVLVLGWMIT